MRFLVLGAVLLLGYTGIYIAAVHFSKDRVAEELMAAVQNKDLETIEDRLDIGAIKSFLKKDLIKKSSAVRSGGMNMQIGPPPDKIAETVDFYITPEKVALALDLRTRIFKNYEPKHFIQDVSYEGPFAFSITVGAPQKEGSITTMSDAMMAMKFVFKAHSWRWQAKEIHMPLFMVPRKLYDEGDIEQFLSQNPLNRYN